MMIMGCALAPTKSVIESLNFLGFQKIRVVVGNWIKLCSFNWHQRKFNTFFAFTGHLIGRQLYLPISYRIIELSNISAMLMENFHLIPKFFMGNYRIQNLC